MIATRLLQVLSDIAGVTGSFVVSSDGELAVHAMPPDLDEQELRLTARRVARILQCGAANGVQGEEALFDFGAGRLLVREFIGGYLCVLCEGRVEMRGLRLAARLVARGMPREQYAGSNEATGISSAPTGERAAKFPPLPRI